MTDVYPDADDNLVPESCCSGQRPITNVFEFWNFLWISLITSILLAQVRVPSTPSMLFSIYFVQIVYLSYELACEKNENKQKEAGIGPFLKFNCLQLINQTFQSVI